MESDNSTETTGEMNKAVYFCFTCGSQFGGLGELHEELVEHPVNLEVFDHLRAHCQLHHLGNTSKKYITILRHEIRKL